MPTLNIQGVGRVKVDEAFTSMTPEEQAKAVEEIAGQIRGAPNIAASRAPASDADSRIEGAFEAAADQPETRLSKGAPGGYGFTDYLQSSLPFGDEVAAAGGGLGRYLAGKTGLGPEIGLGDAYNQQKALEGRYREEYAADNPGKAMGATALGIATAGPARAAAAAPSLAGRVMQGTKGGAGIGAVYGAGEGEGLAERAQNAGMGAAGGAVVGAAVPAVASGVGRGIQAARGTMPQSTAPSVDQLKAASHAAYNRADQAGLVVSRNSFGNAVSDIANTAKLAGINKTIHPKATAALNELGAAKASGMTPTLQELDTMRRVLKSAAASIEPDERRIASLMVDRLDNYMGRLSPFDVVAGDAQKANAAIREARDLWSRARKGEIVENLVERAKTSAPNFSGSGMENALRTEFRALAKNPKAMRQFTKAEQEAIKKVARGGPVENTLRMLGKFAPTGIVSSALSGGVGYGVGGPLGAVAVPAAGYVARNAATAMTQNNVAKLGDLVRSGGRAIPPRPLTPAQNIAFQSGRLTANEGIGTAVPYLNRAVQEP